MFSCIFLATGSLLSGDPEGIVRGLEQAGESGEITLFLYPEGWPYSDLRLVFSKGPILLRGESGFLGALAFRDAVRKVAEAQLLMRRAAVFAQAIQRLARERRLSEEEALLTRVCWEFGYDSPDEVPDGEEGWEVLQYRAEGDRKLFRRGLEILPLIPEKSIQAPTGVSAWILDPPSEIGIQWAAAPQGDSLPDTTRLEEWLAVPPEEIVRALRRAASQKGRVTLIMADEKARVAKLFFHQDGRMFVYKNRSDCPDRPKPSPPWPVGKKHRLYIVKWISDKKTALRRAVVRAVAFRQLVEGRGLLEAACLIALAEYGFARLDDVPPAGRSLINKSANRHRAIIQTGMRVLEVLGQPSGGGGHGIVHEDQAG
jgi:hypothetical protein